mmetsp:Transcript_26636/g.30489  ORF Transcript_26636/g.30489 Transcript_26636/m.30489 type:complete len:617 (+) Transcript_26636:206-2056(+)
MKLSSSLLAIILLRVVYANGEASKEDQKPYQCSLYMAPSSIPHSGFGVYTGRKIPRNSAVQPYSNSVSLAVTDVTFHTENEDSDYWSHVDYLWSGSGLAEFEADEVSENVFVMGCLANFHTYLKNLHPESVEYDDTIADRFTDPGAGAFSYHAGHLFTAVRDIEAGEELFADYGEEWLDSREETFADYVPRQDDFRKAATIVNKITKHQQNLGDKQYSMLRDIVNALSDRVATVLPKTSQEFKDVNSRNSRKNDLTKLLALNTVLERNLTWVEENGLCLDLIRPGISTIPGAGRGAFSQGYIQEGTIISPAPLLTIPNSDNMLMYEWEDDEETGEKVKIDEDIPIGKQIAVNYCFGHLDSKLLLCPMTNMLLMNHCSNRISGEGHCGNRGPNAKVQWATNWDKDTPEWLKMSLDEIEKATQVGSRGLSFEVVATRDIAPGEEVLIDYGLNWETAWQEHVENWEAPETPDYVPVRTMKEFGDLRSIDELETDPYPANVQLVCYFDKCDEEDEEEEKVLDGKYMISRVGLDAEEDLYYCEIIEKPSDVEINKNEKESFTVRVFCSEEETYLVKSYPKESITFRMEKYASDQHLPGVFRHFIEIDDEIFPEEWKNVKDA